MQFSIYILGILTGLVISILVIIISKRNINAITTFLEKPNGEVEIVGDSDEQAIIRENLTDNTIIL